MFFAVFAATALLSPARTGAQTLAPYAVETVISVDDFGGQNVSHQPQVIIDVTGSVRAGDHWQLFVRPWIRQPRPTTPTGPTPDLDTQLYQAGARYERGGPVAVRLDLGYMTSPVGLGMLDWRPDLNPTIGPHLGYVVPMPAFDPRVPRQSAISSSYPLGSQLTLSTSIWDARAAVVNSSPTRNYAVGAATKPRQTPVLEAGGGVTPVVGLRLGASMAHGAYATASELTGPASDDRQMTLVSLEGEYAVRYTKIAGEFVRTAFDTPTAASGSAIAYEWFVQGQQTLTPRWFVAARREGTSAPPLTTGIVPGRRLVMGVFEATAGFRLNPELTLRGSYYTRRVFTATEWDQQAGVSLVWARRWR